MAFTQDCSDFKTLVTRNIVGHVIGPKIGNSHKLQLRGYADGEERIPQKNSGVSLEHDGNLPSVNFRSGEENRANFRIRHDQDYFYFEKNNDVSWSTIMVLGV